MQLQATLFRGIIRLRAARTMRIVLRIATGTFNDGFTNAGNLAYLSLLTLFPFFIVVATVAGALGRTDDGLRAVDGFLRTVPPDVGALIAAPVRKVLATRASGRLLTFGILVTLWTVSGFIETIRELIRRSYGTAASQPVWRYRISAILLIVAAVLLMVVAFAVQVLLTGVEQFVVNLLPFAGATARLLGLGRLLPAGVLMLALYGIFYVLTPGRYRAGSSPIWPGAALTTVVWIGTTMLLPVVLRSFGSYDLTYGSLAGVIVALLFFYIIGLGLVAGAQLNAALAIIPKVGQKRRADQITGS